MTGFFHEISSLVMEADGGEKAVAAIKGVTAPLDSSWEFTRDMTVGLSSCLISCSRAGPFPMWKLIRQATYGLFEMSQGTTDQIRRMSTSASIEKGMKRALHAWRAARILATPFAEALAGGITDRIVSDWVRHMGLLAGCARVMDPFLGESAPYFRLLLADMQDDKCSQLEVDMDEGPLRLNSKSSRNCMSWAKNAEMKFGAFLKVGYPSESAAQAVRFHLPAPWDRRPA